MALSASVWNDYTKYDLGYNQYGATLSTKFPNLTSGAYTFSITAGNNSYTIAISYNKIAEWVGLRVYDNNLECIQEWTYINPFPCNLLIAPDLREYGLFYLPATDGLYFGELPSGWYNGLIDYDDMLEYITYKRIIEG